MGKVCEDMEGCTHDIDLDMSPAAGDPGPMSRAKAKVWESASMNTLWEINQRDTLNSRDNETFGHPPAHPVRTCAWKDRAAWLMVNRPSTMCHAEGRE